LKGKEKVREEVRVVINLSNFLNDHEHDFNMDINNKEEEGDGKDRGREGLC
jgi:hypothetical protein